MAEIKVGTCGYGYFNPPRGWKKKYKSKLQAYSDFFKVGEINRTFYQLPMVKTTERWRSEVMEDFEFTLKVWQAITHPTSSPTWRKRKDALSQEQQESFGLLRPNAQVLDAWEQTRQRAHLLEAKVCVFQCPESFTCTSENRENMRRFFNSIDRGGLEIAWEPRGNWNENMDKIKELCGELDLIHVVDLMRRKPVSDHPIAYIRLHGLNPREYDYNYTYSEDELKQLADRLKELSQDHDQIYCMFNNFAMYENARRLMELL
ncbi:MAG: DUF72 domain-containing protein [Spirochaetota bacterium]